MAAKLSDAEFIERHRAANRVRSQRTRERRYDAGRVALTVWVAESTKARLLALAAAESAPVAEVADRLLSAALAPSIPTSTPARPSTVDTLPLFDTAAALRPGGTESGSVDDRLARIQALKREQPTLSNYAIAAQVGCSEPTVRRALKRLQAETTV